MGTQNQSFWQDKKVIIIDDFEMVRSMVIRAMCDLKVGNIDEAENGEVAWKKIVEASDSGAPYDLVFSDWVMPSLTGIELFEKMRADVRFKETPFVMFTVEADQSSVKLALSKGIKHFMVKPILRPKLVEKLKDIEAELALLAKKKVHNV